MRGRVNLGIMLPGENLLHPGSALGRDAKNVDQDIANTSGLQDGGCAQATWPEQQL